MTETSHTLLAAALLIATTAAASAGGLDHSAELTDRQQRQVSAIDEGRADGSITWFERFVLRREQARITQLHTEALADGHLSRDEYRLIRQAQDDASRHINRERHDSDVRGWWWRLWR